MTKQRTSLIIAGIFLLTSACSNREPVPILTDYEVALTSDKPMRYYYHRMPEDDTTTTEYRTIFENQEKFVVEESYAKGLLQSKTKYRINDQTQEAVEKIYYHVRDSLTGELEAVPADILRHLPHDPENGRAGASFTDYYEMSTGIGVKVITETKYVREETWHYDGRDIESIRLDHRYIMISYFKYLPVYFHETEIKGYVIYTKGIGYTYYWAEDSDGLIHSQKLLKMEPLI